MQRKPKAAFSGVDFEKMKILPLAEADNCYDCDCGDGTDPGDGSGCDCVSCDSCDCDAS